MRTLVWFRGKELRVADHGPLAAAARDGEVIPLFVLDPYFFAPARAQELPHRIQFLLESLAELEENIARLGSRLLIAKGRAAEVVPHLAEAWRVDRVASQRWTEPFGRERDRRIAAALHVPFELFDGETLLPPETIRTAAGEPFSVFTPFSRAFFAEAERIAAPIPPPRSLPALPSEVTLKDAAKIPALPELGLTPNARLAKGGETAGRARVGAFLRRSLATYADDRDRVAIDGTSGTSADLKFGTVSPRAIWRAVHRSVAFTRAPRSARTFCTQLIWREFAHACLWDRPALLAEPFRPGFASFPWQEDERAWSAWIEGTTGYPIVDAAARQLYAVGFVHNRARMIAASFLAKHLLVDFRRGEAHYMKYLVDGDWANNDMGWQWSAGCGCDAQPYFRIFNPTLQGERFDPDGDYVRRWVPALAKMSAKYIHRPWEAPAHELAAAGVQLGRTYPKPFVNHSFARDRFLRIAAQHLKSRPPKEA